MNAASISTPHIIPPVDAADSDSDASSDGGLPDYYHPISSSDVDADADDNDVGLNGFDPAVDQHAHSSLPNGYDHPTIGALQNGLRSFELNGNEGDTADEEEEEEEEMRRVAESEAALRRAFLEDELRRNAPLPSHTSARVMEAMRSVSFSGTAPHWSLTLSQDRWLPQLHRLRHPPSSS